jgi:hypothetical protein
MKFLIDMNLSPLWVAFLAISRRPRTEEGPLWRFLAARPSKAMTPNVGSGSA